MQAGVVIEMETKNLRSNRIEGIRTIFAQGRMLAMQDTDGKVMMIFRGDRMLVIDHGQRSYMEIDEKTMQEIGGKMNDAMKQMKMGQAKSESLMEVRSKRPRPTCWRFRPKRAVSRS